MMFRGVLRTAVQPRAFVWNHAVRFNSSFNQLKPSEGAPTPNNSKPQTPSLNDVLSLLNLTIQTTSGDAEAGEFNRNGKMFSFAAHTMSPKDTANLINVQLPMAGRCTEVRKNNLGEAIQKLNRIGGENKIRYLKKQQARFTRPAKLAKQKRREWWRRRFSDGFKELMDQVRDAKRRGY